MVLLLLVLSVKYIFFFFDKGQFWGRENTVSLSPAMSSFPLQIPSFKFIGQVCICLPASALPCAQQQHSVPCRATNPCVAGHHWRPGPLFSLVVTYVAPLLWPREWLWWQREGKSTFYLSVKFVHMVPQDLQSPEPPKVCVSCVLLWGLLFLDLTLSRTIQ